MFCRSRKGGKRVVQAIEDRTGPCPTLFRPSHPRVGATVKDLMALMKQGCSMRHLGGLDKDWLVDVSDGEETCCLVVPADQMQFEFGSSVSDLNEVKARIRERENTS